MTDLKTKLAALRDRFHAPDLLAEDRQQAGAAFSFAVLQNMDEIIAALDAVERIADLSERWPDSLVSQINEIARAALEPQP